MATTHRPDPDFNEGAAFLRLRKMLEDPRDVLESIGAMLVAQSHKAFKDQKMGKASWKERMNPNFPGVIADLTHGSNVKARRFQSRPALIDTGRLRKSVASRVVSEHVVEVGSNLPYAGPLHAGEDSETLPLTETVQKRLEKWIKRKTGGAKRASKKAAKTGSGDDHERASRAVEAFGAAESLRWMLNPELRDQTFTISHPARPIVGLPDQLVADIETELGVQVRKSK